MSGMSIRRFSQSNALGRIAAAPHSHRLSPRRREEKTTSSGGAIEAAANRRRPSNIPNSAPAGFIDA